MWDDEKMPFKMKLQVSGFNSCWMVKKRPVIHTENPGEGATLVVMVITILAGRYRAFTMNQGLF